MKTVLLPEQLCLQQKVGTAKLPNCLLVMARIGIKSHVAYIMFNKVIMNLSGKVLRCWQVKCFQLHGQTQTLCEGGQCSEGFADSAPMGFVWPHPSPSNSIQLWFKYSCWRGAVSHDPEASVCTPSETSILDDSYEQPATVKETSLCMKSSPLTKSQCFVITC